MSNAREDQWETQEDHTGGQGMDALAKALSRGGSRRYLLGGLLAGALAGGLAPTTERAGAAKSFNQCFGIEDRQQLRQCLRRAKRRTKRKVNPPGQGLLRNFALTVVNNSDRTVNGGWWFVVGSDGIFGTLRKAFVRAGTTKRLVIEDDEAIFFVPSLLSTSDGRIFGKTVTFSNPATSEVVMTIYYGGVYNEPRNTIDNEFKVENQHEIQVGWSRTVNTSLGTLLVKRNPDSPRYKEFTLTFSH